MSENLHLDGDFTLNIPSYEANFTENEQPDIQADFNISIAPNIEGSELITVNFIGDTYKITSINYTHEQGVASDTWIINHNLNKYPSVTLVDSAGTQFQGRTEYIDENNCIVYMNGATKGKAYLN